MGLPPTHTQATRAEMFLASFYVGLDNNKLQFCRTTAVWNKFTVPEKATVEEELGSKTTHPAVSCSSSTSLFRPLLGFEIPQFKFRVALRPQRPFRLLEAGSPGWPPRLSHSSWALRSHICSGRICHRAQHLKGSNWCYITLISRTYG